MLHSGLVWKMLVRLVSDNVVRILEHVTHLIRIFVRWQYNFLHLADIPLLLSIEFPVIFSFFEPYKYSLHVTVFFLLSLMKGAYHKSPGAFAVPGGDGDAVQKSRCAGILLVHDPLQAEGGAAHATNARPSMCPSWLSQIGTERQEVL